MEVCMCIAVCFVSYAHACRHTFSLFLSLSHTHTHIHTYTRTHTYTLTLRIPLNLAQVMITPALPKCPTDDRIQHLLSTVLPAQLEEAGLSCTVGDGPELDQRAIGGAYVDEPAETDLCCLVCVSSCRILELVATSKPETNIHRESCCPVCVPRHGGNLS